MLMSIGNFQESLGQQILAGIILIARLGLASWPAAAGLATVAGHETQSPRHPAAAEADVLLALKRDTTTTTTTTNNNNNKTYTNNNNNKHNNNHANNIQLAPKG